MAASDLRSIKFHEAYLKHDHRNDPHRMIIEVRWLVGVL